MLPNVLAVSGKTRQNDLDIGFTISIQPGASTRRALVQAGEGGDSAYAGNQENRQAFLTFGDASWGTVKVGKDLGIFASDAILSDMTLLGVGAGAGSLAGNTTTLGRIGTGYMYADWKSQISYASPNWNGFQFVAGVTQAWDGSTYNGADDGQAILLGRKNNQPTFEAKASYSFAGDVSGKVWASAITQRYEVSENIGQADAGDKRRGTAYDFGANVNYGNAGLTAYYYNGKGVGTTGWLVGAIDSAGKRTDSEGGYIQGTYIIPTGTKLGLSWGQSTLDSSDASNNGKFNNSSWIVGAYHPITKSLNLVAEYNSQKVKFNQFDDSSDNVNGRAKTVSLGAILFF